MEPLVLTWILVVPVAFVYMVIAFGWFPRLIGNGAPRQTLNFFPGSSLAPEPLEQARYLLAVTAPVALIALSTAATSAPSLRRAARRRFMVVMAVIIQILILALVALSWWRQNSAYRYFRTWQLYLSLSGAITAVALMPRSGHRRPTGRNAGHEKGAAIAIAVLATLAGLSYSIFRDANIGSALKDVQGILPFPFEEFAAVSQGRTGLVDFFPQYTVVLPYLTAVPLKMLGPSIGAFTGAMYLVSAVALTAVFFAFTRLTGHPGSALGLYLPFLLITLYPAGRQADQVFNSSNYYPAMPLRYFGPMLLMGLVARYLQKPSPRALFGTFLLAGFVVLNNFEFGLPALAAAATAVTLGHATGKRLSLRDALARIAVAAAAVSSSLGIFTAFTLARAGRAPSFGSLLYFTRQFALNGFFMLPMPALGLHTVVYLTFAAALVLAGIRALALHDPGGGADRIRTGLLAYSGVFGLGALAYYAGRSHPLVLVSIFPAWGLALCLLAWEAWTSRSIVRSSSPWMRPFWRIPALLVLFHVGLFLSTLPDQSLIFRQPARIAGASAPRIFEATAMKQLIRDCAGRAERTMIFYPLGYRLAGQTGVQNFFPYNSPVSIVTAEQLGTIVKMAKRQRVQSIFSGRLRPEIAQGLSDAGFRPVLIRTNPSFRPDLAFVGVQPELVYWRRATGAPPESPCSP